MRNFMIGLLATLFWTVSGQAMSVKELVDERSCLFEAEHLFNNIDRILRVWFIEKDSSFHLESKFRDLSALEDANLKSYGEFLKKWAAIEGKDPQELIRKLDGSHHELNSKQAEMIVRESDFIVSLYYIEKGLQSYKNAAAGLKERCPALGTEVDEAIGILGDLIGSTNKLRTYVTIVQTKRLAIGPLVIGVSRAHAYVQLAQRLGQKLEDFAASIDQALAVERMASKVDDWWFRTTEARGEEAFLDTTWLTFESAMRRLHEDLATADVLKQELDAIKAGDQSARQIVDRRLKTYRDNLQRRLDAVRSKGWQGQMSEQVGMVRELSAAASELSAECRMLLNVHAGKAKLVKDADAFKDLEVVYAGVVTSCLRGGGQ